MSEQAKHADSAGWNALVSYLRSPSVLLSALGAITLILYSGTLVFQFVWDDKAQIVDSPIIRSLGNLHRVFVSDLWYHTGRFQLYYRPLFVVWSILNYAVAGLHPWAWHLAAVLMHVAAVMAVFWLARKLGLEYWTAALAALIFALHPIHIECVAWISAVSDSMVTLFAALSFSAYLSAREPDAKNATWWRIASLLFLACALLTKEIVLCFAALVALYEWLFPAVEGASFGAKVRNAFLAALPYAALTVGYLMLRQFALHQVTGKFDPNHTNAEMFFTLPYVLVFYLRQLVLPIGLTGLYYMPYVTPNDPGKFLVPVIALTILAGLIYFWSRKKDDKLVIFAPLWMLISLAPALYLRSFTDGDFVRDRYMYLGSIGFAILMAKLTDLIPPIGNLASTQVQGVAVAVLCFGYVGLSLPQQAYWDSDLLIYSRGYELYPQNPYTAVGLAREYSRRGAYDRAIPIVEAVYKNNPHYLYGAYALADVYIGAGRKEQGRAALIYAQELMPEYLKAETGGAAVAAMWGKLGDYDRALELCSKVLAQDPDLYSGLYNCGNINLMAGHYAEAEQLLLRAVQTAPELAGSRHFLGRALFLEVRYPEAQLYLSQAVAIDPNIYDYHYWLGRSLEQSGDKAGAEREYEAALQINADSEETKERLAELERK
jgi:tetratricopeptide (TPR) repeat protein